MLIMLYYLTQNADFEKTVKPLMGSLKDSENVLKFMNDLSKFSELFSMMKPKNDEGKPERKHEEKGKPEKKPAQGEHEKKQGSPKEEPTDPIANEHSLKAEKIEKRFG